MLLINVLAAAKNAIADWRRRQQAFAELSALDDRSLADIGINRSDIPAIVEGFQGLGHPAPESDFPGFNPARARAGDHKWFPLFPAF